MFHNELKQKLQKIFLFKKTTYDAPSVNSTTGTFEQECLFIEITNAKFKCKANKETAEVSGILTVFAQMDKMPFGHLQKRIEQADPADKENFFFFDIDLNVVNSPARLQNISERQVKFVYLHSAQYDPEHGELTSVEGI